MSRNQMEFETANGEVITLELSDEKHAQPVTAIL